MIPKSGYRFSEQIMLNESTAPKRFPEWERAVRPPVPLPPPKACDCQAHIFGDLSKYPTQPGAAYIPISARSSARSASRAS